MQPETERNWFSDILVDKWNGLSNLGFSHEGALRTGHKILWMRMRYINRRVYFMLDLVASCSFANYLVLHNSEIEENILN